VDLPLAIPPVIAMRSIASGYPGPYSER